jgi:hypothetical protein
MHKRAAWWQFDRQKQADASHAEDANTLKLGSLAILQRLAQTLNQSSRTPVPAPTPDGPTTDR